MIDRPITETDGDDIKQILSTACPDTSPPAGAKERVLARVLEAQNATEKRSVGMGSQGEQPGHLPWGFLKAAAAVVVVGVCCWLFIDSATPAVADLAEVLQHVRKALTVTFEMTTQSPGRPEETARMWLDDRGHSRTEWSDGRIHVSDNVQRRLLSISPQTKEARLISARGWSSSIIESLGKQKAGDGIYLGVGKIGTIDAEVYRIPQGSGDISIWVDGAKQLPLRVRVRKIADDGQETVVELKDMHWNIALEPSLFAMEAPPGYTIVRPYENLSEKDLVYLLSKACELNGGRFPQTLEVSSIVKLNSVEIASKDNESTSVVGYMSDEDKALLRPCLRGFYFVEELRRGGSWAYTGAGISLGDVDAIVCWWRPRSGEYRAIYGDLRAENVPESQVLRVSEPATTAPSGS